MFSFRKAIGLVALSAILIALSFVPYNLYLLGFIGFLPLFFVFENFTPNKKQIFFLWLVWVLILNFIAYHWIMHTIAVYGMMPTAVAFPLFLLYTLGTSGKMLLFFIFLNHIQKKSPLFSGTYTTLFAIVVAFGLAELVGWQLFPWYGGNIVSGDLYFAQAADIIGTRGLSLVWTLLQYLFYLTLKEAIRLKKEKAWKAIGLFRPLWISIAILALTHSYGAIRYHQAAAKENSATKVRVGVPQGNVPLITYRHERPYIISRMLAQTENLVQEAAAAQKPLDLVVWPESSIPAMEFERSNDLKQAILALQTKTQTPIIINDILHDPSTRKDYSNMWHLDGQGVPLANYQKHLLLPFGEFMPMGETFPTLKNLFPAVSDFSHGTKFSLFNIATRTGFMKAMPLVCYEVILPNFAQAFDNKTSDAAQFIINITNDAWFGDSVESIQHLTLGVMRAIELRLPIVRATNSGISAYIASNGSVHGKTRLFERVNAVYEVPSMPRSTTLFAFWGYIPLYLFLFFGVGWFAYKAYRLRTKKSK